MRILFLGHTYAVKMNREKLYHLNGKIDLHLVTPEKWKDKMFTVVTRRDNILNHHISRTLLNGHEKIFFYISCFGQKIRKIKPDIIHVEEGMDAISYFQTILAKKLFWPKAKMVCFTWMNIDYELPFPLNLIEKFNINNTDFLICGNRDAIKIARKHDYKGPVSIIPQLGINLAIFRKRKSATLKRKLSLNNFFTIGYFGRLVREKGLMILLEAAKELKGRWKVLIIGRGELKQEMLEKIKKYSLREKVVFIDSIHHTDVVKYMNCLDVFVLPSATTPKWKEQFGHVLVEAMACEVPIIGSSSGEIPNVIGNAGLIFKEGDANDLRKKIEYLIENEKVRKKYAKLGRKRVLASYTNKIIAEKTYKIYRSILNGKI